ncbi:ComEC/Rec2 family competence protein [Bacillota bacterium Meth-B3]|nr:MBL fold metallo-hydrolase [Christensenellaceae bacterium]MEA5066835.1 MBL fold metallo-hydrolase [Eubacteriales bacterium]MEA5069345.1 MBL fold metallo-hydrolase [Christensenellaceae bacterium]
MSKYARCACWIALLMCAMALTACAQEKAPGKPIATLTFFDAGSADAILIETPGSAVLVDAGLKEDAPALIAALERAGVSKLDALIITHFDKDHVGGAAQVIEALPIGRAYEPDYEKHSKHVNAYRAALVKKGVASEALDANTAFELDGIDYDIDVANEAFYGEDEENDFSLVIRLTAGDARALLAGDAERARLIELLDEGDLKSGLLKVPHHGRYNKISPIFFAAVEPKHAVITSSEGEPEEDETVYALERAGAQVWLTRRDAVVAETDGRGWTVGQP